MVHLLLSPVVGFLFLLNCYDIWADAQTGVCNNRNASRITETNRYENTTESCCHQLRARFGSQVSFPNSTAYNDQQNGTDGYWTAQEASVMPACRLASLSTKDVSIAVEILSQSMCKFAVRGGGHMSWAGAANIQDGVTIDLGLMKAVTVSPDSKTASVGSGARWQDVYLKLDAMSLSVAGGRVYDVGVGGLLLGGGNSFFAPRYGFACDNVANFEVVLDHGRVANANPYENPDLFRALKGASNNLGIVTRFDLKTFQQGKLWGGFVIYPFTTVAQQLQSLQEFTTASGAGLDSFASVINAFIFTAAGLSFIANQYTYTKAESYPSILENFTNIQPQLHSTMRITNLTDLTIELGAGTPNGFRQLFGTATFVNNAALFAHLLTLAEAAFLPVQTVKSFQASFVLQPIPKSITSKADLNGGNSLGLNPDDGDLVWLDLTIQWSEASDDVAINAATQSLLRQAVQYAKSHGQYNEYLYLNYALQQQDPIAGYGKDNQAFLRAVSKKYDPWGVFQTLVPGGFKLYRHDSTCC